MMSSTLSHRHVFAIAAPMIISNLTVPLLGLVDTAVVGHMDSPTYLGAVAVGAMIFAFLFWGFGFLRMGMTGLSAQSLGENDADGLVAHMARGVLLALGFGAALCLFQIPIFEFALGLMDASDEVTFWSREYLQVRIWAAPFTLSTYVFVGWLLGNQDARGPLLITVLTNVVNITLDLLFVVEWEWGVVGVARASLIAEICGATMGAWLVYQKTRSLHYKLTWSRLLNASEMKRTLVVNRDIMVRTLLLIFAFAFFTRQGARFGNVVLAANAVLLNFMDLMAYGLDGFAHAAEALVGKAVGEGRRKQFDRAVVLCGQWSVALAGVFALTFALGGTLIVDVMTDLPEVRAAARAYLPWVTLAPLIAVGSFLLDGVFIGATRTQDMRNVMVLSVLGCYLPVWYLTQGLGNHGLWLSMIIFLAARGFGMAWVYRRRALWFSSTI